MCPSPLPSPPLISSLVLSPQQEGWTILLHAAYKGDTTAVDFIIGHPQGIATIDIATDSGKYCVSPVSFLVCLL